MNQYVQSNSYETTQLDGEWLILDTDNFTVTKLNEVGGFCWSLLEQYQTVKSIVTAVENEFGSVNESVQDDIKSFLAELIDCGLVRHAS
jgi:hypothetical protein